MHKFRHSGYSSTRNCWKWGMNMRKARIIGALTCCLLLAGCGKQAQQPVRPAETMGPSLPAHKETAGKPELLQEQVIYDSESIRITVKGLEENTMTGTRIRVLVENGTERNIAFSGDLFVVNGVTMPGYLYTEVAAGMKANDGVELFGESLETAGILQVGTVRGVDARIVDTDTYETLAQVPFYLETAYAQDLDYRPDETGVELYRAGDVTVTAQVISDVFYGKTARLLVKNEGDRDVIVEAEHVSVNGYTLDAWLYDTVCAGTVRYCQLDLFEMGLAENGIEQIETVTFRLNILDAQSYETLAQSELLTVTVQG